MDFTDKIVLVTGGSRGIGRAICVQFAKRGAKVAVHYGNNEAAAAETLAMLEGEGHIKVRADMARQDEVETMVKNTIENMGGLDILVNNAGIFEEHKIAEVDYERWQDAWQQIIAVNLFGPANAIWCAAQHMINHGGGRIVNVSSRGAFRGEPDAPAYGASKAGMNSMSQSLAKALAPHKIYVTTVAPGWVDTDMAADHLDDSIKAQSPLNRVATPDEIAHAVLYMASEGAEFTTGAILDVNGASYLRN
jgi:NAD(P)-dependent dehydrogenase (short-subunit alcohol dehydrogenase family)